MVRSDANLWLVPFNRNLFISIGICLVLVLYFGQLIFDIPLVDPDEGKHASIALEMVETGDWIVPRLAGTPFRDKPPLFFWLQAASLKIFGIREASVRLPGLLAGLGISLSAGLVSLRLFEAKTAWASFFSCAVMVFPWACSQVPVHDVLSVCCTNLAIFFLLRGHSPLEETGGSHPPLAGALAEPVAPERSIIAAGICLGGAILTKGLMGPLFFLFFLGARFFVERRFPVTVQQGIVIGGLALFFSAPWYLAMSMNVPGYASYYFIERHLLGFATESQRHGDRPFWYYVPILAFGALPWTLYLPAWIRMQLGAKSPKPILVLVYWFLLGLTFLSCAGSKLATYALPLFTPLGILVGVCWKEAFQAVSQGEASPGIKLWWGIYRWSTNSLPCLGLAAWVLLSKYYPEASHLGLVLCGLSLPVLWLNLTHRYQLSLIQMGGCWLAVVLSFLYGNAPELAANYSARNLAQQLNRIEASSILFYEERVGSIFFYLSPAQRARLRTSPEASIRRVNDDDLQKIPPFPGLLLVVPFRELERAHRSFALEEYPSREVDRYRIYEYSR